MPEIIDNKKIFTLLEVSQSIQKTIAKRYTTSFWVKGEMLKLNHYTHSGHCYPDLVEKQNGKVIAQLRAILWRGDYTRINSKFIEVLQEPLKDGIKILFLASISFDPVHGLSLRIIDIDPAYTMGDLEKEKQNTLNRLRKEGIFDKNKQHQLPLLPQRIAIISVETSKGYADFIKVIENNPWKYKFFHLLFPSILQGEKAVPGIIKQLDRIKKIIHHFDLVAIIRGGGGDIGLSCYNDYQLTKEVANFPLPVITGIGHATNLTVIEMISFENAITPTKLAEILIQQFHDFAQPVQLAESIIAEHSQRYIADAKAKLHSEVKLFRSVTQNILNTNRNEISRQIHQLSTQSAFRFKSEKGELVHLSRQSEKGTSSFLNNKHEKTTWLFQKLLERSKLLLKTENAEIANLEKNIEIMDPKNVLKRGYSITRINGSAIKDKNQVEDGDEINTSLYKGNIISIVKSKKSVNK